MNSATIGDQFDLEPVEVEFDSGDDDIEEIPVEDALEGSDGEEGLDQALKKAEDAERVKKVRLDASPVTKVSLEHTPEVVDDFVRNFLFRMGMMKTLNCFQAEWYEMEQSGRLKPELVVPVSNANLQCAELEKKLYSLKSEVERFQRAAEVARAKLLKVAKARDFHCRQHRNCVQEKNRLLADVKRLRKQCASHEPVLRQMKEKYEAIMREKTLTRIEMERTANQVASLQAALQGIEEVVLDDTSAIGNKLDAKRTAVVPERVMRTELKRTVGDNTAPARPSNATNEAQFPPPRSNPHAKAQTPRRTLDTTNGLGLDNTVSAHGAAVSGLCLHPDKQLVVSASDDHSWKMWSIPSGELVTAGEGHTSWLSDADFNPSGTHLATASGDATVRIWEFARGLCTAVLAEHAHAVWGCSWHWAGDFLASCAMDNLSRIWDITSLKCRNVLRGHTDSVNSICFVPFTNNLCTSSADKTVSLWDARTGLSTHTFYGHQHSVNHATPSLKGDIIASCDSYGVVQIFDIRTISSILAVNLGPHPANRLALHPAGNLLAVASNDSTIKLVDLQSQKILGIGGHDDAVHTVLFDHDGNHLISGSTDCTIRVWS